MAADTKLMTDEMDKSLESLKREMTKLRTGRASTALVDGIHVDYYGSNVPLNQVGNVTTPDARTIQIAPWEQGMIGAIEKAILAANIGLTPQNDGKMIRISVPALTEAFHFTQNSKANIISIHLIGFSDQKLFE